MAPCNVMDLRRQLISLAIGTGLSAQVGLVLGVELVLALKRSMQQDSSQITQVPDPDPAHAALLERARLWQFRGRDDLARQVLDKLFRMAPEHPDGLLLLGQIQLRADQDAAARKTIERLRKASPDHPGAARLTMLSRLKGPDKDKLKQARQLAKVGRSAEALAMFRALYTDGFPDDELELEYWQLTARTENGWEPARAGINSLVRRSPDNPRFQLALAEHLATRKPIDLAALKTMIELSKTPAYAKQALEAWRRAVMRLDPIAASIPPLQEYLEHEPGDTTVKEHLDSVIQAVESQRKLLADPGYRAKLDGLALLDGGHLDAAEDRLRQSIAIRPNDADAVGGMGLLRLRQGRHAEAQTYFLRARHLDATQRDKWDGLIRTTHYWGLLAQSNDARVSKEFMLAEQKLMEARTLDPREPNAVVALARLYAEQDRIDDAEKMYRQALGMAPANSGALEGLIALYLRAGRDSEADALLVRLTPAQRKDIGGSINTLRAALLRDKAKLMQSQTRSDEAVAMLESAAAIDPTDPWLRFDLARLYTAQGAPDKGQALFDALLERRPDDPAALYAQALFQSGTEREFAALTSLERIPDASRNAGMAQLQRRLWVSVQSKRAVTLATSGQQAEAMKIVASAQEAIGNDLDLGLDVAGAYVEIGESGAARNMLELIAAGQALPSLALYMSQARLLDRMGADAELRMLLEKIETFGPLTQEQNDTVGDLKLSLSLRQAETLRAAGLLAEALQTLQAHETSQAQRAPNGRLLYAQARILRALQRWDEAQDRYRRILQLNPADMDAMQGLIETLIAAGQRDQARELMAQQIASLPGADPDFSVALVGSLIAIEDYGGAQSLVESVLETSPDHPRALAYAGQLARRDGRIDQAIDYLQRSLASEMTRRAPDTIGRLSRLQRAAGESRGAALVTEIVAPEVVKGERDTRGNYRQLSELLDQRTTWLSSALDWRSRSGTMGKSQISAQEIPLEWKQGWSSDYSGRWFFRADAARIDTGALDLADTTEAATFGSLLLCQPACNNGTVPQLAQGVALSAGLERDKWRLDIGTTPLGFRVPNLLGGILYKGDLGPFSYSVDISRRPISSSLLSYAGTKDPNSGQTWGGVVATGVRLGLSRDQGGTYGTWSSLSLHKLSGKNVQGNNRVQLMAGGYMRIINEDDRLLSAGVTGMLWRFSENAGEYTFGHGGYYSPQSYKSLSLPVTFGLRYARFSFTLRAAVSASWSQTKGASYFPTDPGLQAQAEALAPVTGTDPHYAGGSSSRSFGRSLAAAWEYQMSPSLYIGGRMEMDRSANYTPNRFLIYLRFALDGSAVRPVFFPPEAVIPSSQY